MKAVRYISRLTRKRERQMRPLTVASFLQKRFAAFVADFFRWKPAREVCPALYRAAVLPEMMTGDQATAEMAAVPKILQRIVAQRQADHRRALAERSRLRAAVPDSVPQLGEDLPAVRCRADVCRVPRRRRRLVSEHHEELHRPVRLLHARACSEPRTTERLQVNKQKHLALTDFDREILKLAYQQIGSKECDLLHPMYMYRLFYPLLEEPHVDQPGR